MRKVFCLLCLGLFVALVHAETPSGTSVARAEFAEFWRTFRSAVVADDRAAVAALTHFPFATRGETDADPVIRHDRRWFMRRYDDLLQSDPGLTAQPGTMKDLIKVTSEAKMAESAARSVRLANFEFRRIAGKWYFAFAYFDAR